jgi:glycosyltransferase involved in cell wall biosynthesis
VRRRLLLISYFFPPAPANTGRPLSMAKYLAKRGHDVHVLTTAAFGEPEEEIPHVCRAPDLVGNSALRRILSRPPASASGVHDPSPRATPALLTKVVVPDLTLVSWAPSALAMARQIVKRASIDCVITSSPTESAHLVGAALSRRVPWIAEFRDPWSFKPEFPVALQRAADRAMERLVVRRADRLITLQEAAARDVTSRFGREPTTILNAWDPDLAAEAGEAAAPGLDRNKVTLAYTGVLSGPWGRRPDVFFEGLRRLREHEPELADKLEIVLAGQATPEELEKVTTLGFDGTVRHVGRLSRQDSLALQRSAAALLLFTSDRAVEMPGKLFEYIGASRPIIVLGTKSEAARFVVERGVGISVPNDDPEAVRQALRRAATGELQADYDPQGLEAHVYPAPTVAMEEEIEHAIAQRARRATA